MIALQLPTDVLRTVLEDLLALPVHAHRAIAIGEIRQALTLAAEPPAFTDRDIAEAQRLLGIAGALQEEVTHRRLHGGD